MLSTNIIALVPLVGGLELYHTSYSGTLTGNISVHVASGTPIGLGTPLVNENTFRTDDSGHGYSQFHST